MRLFIFGLLLAISYAQTELWSVENEDTETFTTTFFTEAEAREFYAAGLTAERIDCDLEFSVYISQSKAKFSFMTLQDGEIFNINMNGKNTNHQHWQTVDGDCTKITCVDDEQSHPRGKSGYCPQAFYDGSTPKELDFLLLKVEFDPFESNQNEPHRDRFTFKGTTYNVEPTGSPTIEPTGSPTIEPTVSPTIAPTGSPTIEPTDSPTSEVGGSEMRPRKRDGIPYAPKGRPVSATNFPTQINLHETSTELPVGDLFSEDVDVAESSAEKENWRWILFAAIAATPVCACCLMYLCNSPVSQDPQLEDEWNLA